MNIIIKTTLTFCVLCCIAFAQPTGLPRAAVYIMGNPPDRDVLRMLVNNFLVQSGRYEMIDVDAIDVIAREHIRQMSGSVSDAEIAQLGNDAGAQFVCVVEQIRHGGATMISTRMVDVQRKTVAPGLSEVSELRSGERIIDVIQKQIGSMLARGGGTQTPQQTTVTTPTSTPASQAAASIASGSSFTDSLGLLLP